MNEESILSTVENLILVCEEAADGYLHASRKVSDSTLKLLLESYSFQRHTFADRLQGAVPEASPNRAEVLQQQDDHGWSTLIGNKDPMDEASVLAACEWPKKAHSPPTGRHWNNSRSLTGLKSLFPHNSRKS
jgi:hypothetical protein